MAGQPELNAESLAPSLCQDVQDMYVVAHADDDLLFMNPDVTKSLDVGHCVFTVYLTTGDNPVGVANYNAAYGASLTASQYAQQREQGVLDAYAQMGGVSNVWKRGVMKTAGGRSIATANLIANPRVTVAFMRLPEAADKSVDSSVVTLDDLYFGLAPTITSSDGTAYTSVELVNTLAELMTLSQPKYMHIQDSEPAPYIRDENGNTIDDHVDHIIGARFVERAEAQFAPLYTQIRYRDYNINAETVPNLSSSLTAAKSKTFGTYAQRDVLICPPATDCTNVSLFPQWMATDYRGWLSRQYFNIADDQEGGVITPPSGLMQIFLTGDRTSTIRTIGQAANAGGNFGGWSNLGGNFSAKPVAAVYPDGRLAAFVPNNTGGMMFRLQSAVNGAWGAWQSLGGNGVSDAAVTVDRSNRSMQLYVVDTRGKVLMSTDSRGNGVWSPFQAISAANSGFKVWSDPSAARMPTGRTSLFVRDDSGNVRYTTQSANNKAWAAWKVIGQGFLSNPIAAPNSAGRIDLFMRGQGNGLYTRQQDNTDAWTPWQRLGYDFMQFSGQPMVATAPDGRTEVFTRDLDGSVVRYSRSAPGSAWSQPERLPSETVHARSILGVAFDGAGKLNVVVRGVDGRVYSTAAVSADGGWTSWLNLGN